MGNHVLHLHQLVTKKQKLISWINKHKSHFADKGTREFALSIVKQFNLRGHLTDKQWHYAERLTQAVLLPKNKRSPSPFFVYAILAGDSIKIGMSHEPEKRMKSIATGCPMVPSLIWQQEFSSIGKARMEEKRLHKKFQKQRQHGEWFDAVIRNQLYS